MSLAPGRRRQLQELGLRALIKRRFGVEGGAPVPFSGGAAILADGVVAVFADSTAALGSAIDLAQRERASQLCFFCERNTGVTARRAAEFEVPVAVLDPEGDFEPLAPAPPPSFAPIPPLLESAGARMRAAGLDVVWEHEVLLGEWLGLEVARAVVGPDGVTFEVGVGKHDREANRELYPDGSPEELLDHAVRTVRELRRPGAPPHPANQLNRERWLRRVVGGHPELVGLGDLHVGPPPSERRDLRERAVAPAWAAADGVPVVVVFSVGIDPDVVPQAADSRLQAPGWPGFPDSSGPSVGLVIVVPEGDDHPLTRRLADGLRSPARVATAPGDWAAMPP